MSYLPSNYVETGWNTQKTKMLRGIVFSYFIWHILRTLVSLCYGMLLFGRTSRRGTFKLHVILYSVDISRRRCIVLHYFYVDWKKREHWPIFRHLGFYLPFSRVFYIFSTTFSNWVGHFRHLLDLCFVILKMLFLSDIFYSVFCSKRCFKELTLTNWLWKSVWQQIEGDNLRLYYSIINFFCVQWFCQMSKFCIGV